MSAASVAALGSPARQLLAAVALSRRAVPIGTCVGWAIGPAPDVLRLLGEAVERGWLGEAQDGGPGLLESRDDELREALLCALTAEDWPVVFRCTGLEEWGVEEGRARARSGDFPGASRCYRPLVEGLRHSIAPGHREAWLDVFVEALRLFRREVPWLDRELQAEALARAEEASDLGAEAVLSATLAYEAVRSFENPLREELVRRALEASGRLGDPAVARHVRLYVANAKLLVGRVNEAISLLESFIGDVPEELLEQRPLDSHRDTLDEAAYVTLAVAYAWAGESARGRELLEAMIARGEAGDERRLAKLGKVYLAGICAEDRDVEGALRWGERALAELDGEAPGSVYPWLAASALAWARAERGDIGDARTLLAQGQRARDISGFGHPYWGLLAELLPRLADGGGAADERAAEDTVERWLRGPDERLAGIALRVRAPLLADGASAAACFDESARRLRAVGARAELRRTLEAARAWATERGDGARSQAYARELDGFALPPGVTVDASGAERSGRLARAIIDLGRLAAIAPGEEGFWGELLARVCVDFSAERAALVGLAGPPRVLAVRGGDAAWLARVVTFATTVDEPVALRTGISAAETAFVRYEAGELAERGVLAIDLRRGAGQPFDRALLAALGVQLGVLAGNVTLWRELADVRRRLERENRYHRQRERVQAHGEIIGEAPAMRRLYELVARVAPAPTTVLVVGETGSGKELVARAIHDQSARRGSPFIAVHVAAMARGVVASGLFGHERGAFTGATEQVRGRFELADGGTLFLDEIGELGPDEQVRLLRVLQEGAFERVGGTRTIRSDFRLVAATNRDLREEVREKRFREDLYFRLAAFPIRVPPLRERPSDVPLLALHYLEKIGRRLGRLYEGIGEADIDRLLAYRWPGNVRELMHVIERAALLSEPPMLKIPPLDAAPPTTTGDDEAWSTLEEHERTYVTRVLRHTHGRVTGRGGAAEVLGMKPTTLQSRIDKLGLRAELARARAG